MSTNDSTERKWEGTAIHLMSLVLYPAGVLQMLSYRLIGIKAVYRFGQHPGSGGLASAARAAEQI